jgi:RNA recognition motif-containing protein
VSKKSNKKDDEEEDEEEEEKNGEDDKKELFVGNLAFSTTEDSLASAFGEYGTVTNVKLPMNPTG